MISSYIYKKMISGNFFTKRVYGLIRQLLIKLNEHQLCCMKIHGQDLVMPLSHSLPLYLHEFPLYDSLPHRLTGFIKLKSQYIKAIDVGANIGDSIAAFMSPAGPSTEPENLDLFIAVEPNPKFRKCLNLNYGQNKNIIILSCICSSSVGATNASIKESNGTASLQFHNSGHINDENKFEKRTVDSIVVEFEDANKFNLVKKDTDGHDFEVIRGSRDFIISMQPFVYFEVDSFSNSDFAADCIETLNFFNIAGYGKVFIYDNYGYLIGVYSTEDIYTISQLLFYKSLKTHFYYDFLFMKNDFVDEFYACEVEYFKEVI